MLTDWCYKRIVGATWHSQHLLLLAANTIIFCFCGSALLKSLYKMAASLKDKRTPITTLHTKYLVLMLLQTPLFSRWSLPLKHILPFLLLISFATLHCYKDYLKWSSPLENCSSRNEKSPLLALEHFAPCPYWYFTSFYAVKIFRSQKQELLRGDTGKFRKILKLKMCGKTAGNLPHGEGKSRT